MSAVAKIKDETEAPVETKGRAVAKLKPAAVQSVEPQSDFDKILALAENPNVPVERIEQVIGLFQKVEAIKSRQAFEAALADAKAEIPQIVKDRLVSYGEGNKKTSYKHEDLAGIAKQIDPILSKHGLSYRWRTTSKLNEPVTVTCILAHRGGYSEENTLSAGRDDSGGKNAIQAIGSSLTYLQRYTLKGALGLAAAHDDDGKAAGAGDCITDEQADELLALIQESGSNPASFLKIARAETVSDILAKDLPGLKKVLEAKKNNGASQ